MFLTDKASEMKTAFSDIVASIAAGSTYDNVEYLGNEIDITGFESGKLSINYITTLTASETFKVAVSIYQSDVSGSGYDAGTALLASTTVATGALTGSESCYDLNIPVLSQYKRYAKIGITPNLSKGSADTVAFTASLVLAGAKVSPAV